MESRTKQGSEVQQIYKLISEINKTISEQIDKAILVLGKTGAGKSTLTLWLGDRSLKSWFDNRVGKVLIDQVDA